MKINKSTIATSLFMGAIIAATPSCKKDGCTDPNASNFDDNARNNDGSCVTNVADWVQEVTIGSETYKQPVSTAFNINRTLTADTKWLLSGGMFVESGVTLTIEAGTVIYAANDGSTPFLSILQGAKINAIGTDANPIVFTTVADVPTSGSWGGIILNGKATINTGETAEGEGGSGVYGGNDGADNSGTMQYVRVEYAGKILGADNELNGFSFNGVGNGTTIDHIQAYKGADDGIEFFGGTVDLHHAVSTGNEDDSFDWTHGWRGNGNNWLVVQQGTTGDEGIEADNNGDNNAALPFSHPTVSNVTINSIGAGDAGMYLREGTRATITNVIINGAANGIKVKHTQTLNNLVAGDLTVNDITFTALDTSGVEIYITSADTVLQANAIAANNVNPANGATGCDASLATAAWVKQ